MYVPGTYQMPDRDEAVAFMRRFSFGTIVTSANNLPVATHLPFVVVKRGEDIVLISHFAMANGQWKDLERNPVLVIFSEPHAYISPRHYDAELSVPTWNYMSVHAYGEAKIISEEKQVIEILESTIDTYELAYRQQWQKLPQDYKTGMIKGIVAFEIRVTELQGKQKLSQNKTAMERGRIIETLAKSDRTNEQLIAEYMKDLPGDK